MQPVPFAPFDLFQWLPGPVRTAFDKAARTRRYRTGEFVYVQGEPGDQLFRLVSGSVRLSVTREDGRERVYLLFEPGDCFGTSSCIDGEARPHTAEAGSDCEIQVLGKAAFDALRAEHRAFDDALMHLMSRHIRALSGIHAEYSLNDLSARIASRIVSAAQSFGVPGENGIRLSVSLPQSELALMVGSSRQSVSKVLQRFQDDGLITIEYGNLSIHALDRLKRMAQPE